MSSGKLLHLLHTTQRENLLLRERRGIPRVRMSVAAIFNTLDAVLSRKSGVSVQHMGGPVMMMNAYYTMMLFLSGHGGRMNGNKTWMFCPFDFKTEASALTDKQILDVGDSLVKCSRLASAPARGGLRRGDILNQCKGIHTATFSSWLWA